MNGHPSTSQLENLLNENLSDDQRIEIEDHLESCEECISRLNVLSQTLGSLGVMLGTELSAPVVSRRNVTSQIGPYELLQKIGEGGMGSVWMAEQEKPVRRRVALKLVKAEFASKEIIARFEAERQALAMMDHQNIARVLDAGTTDDGQPYFVMELINGVPFVQYCDENRLSIRDRLKLFLPVCSAVQHAHQKGIIHRDLKPSNLLVALQEGRPIPKVIDFGLAKALEHTTRLTDKSLYTEFGRVVGTLQYMAPEQATSGALDIDTRADIFSLGVMLYEILTASTPVERSDIAGKSILDVLTLLREKEPVRPSQRLSSSDHEDVSSISHRRQIAPSRLQQELRGELDWIVMKALEKDRTRRYDTASAMADDIERYLNHEPVQARPPSNIYRLKKFVRKHNGAVAAAALLAVTLMAGIVGTTTGWMGEAAAREKEAVQRRYSEAVAAFVIDDILALTSMEGQSRFDGQTLNKDATLRDLLDRAAGKLELLDDLDPKVKAKLYWIVGVSYRSIGKFEPAMKYLEQSIKLRERVFGENHEESFNARNSHAVALAYVDSDRALPILESLHEQSQEYLGENHPRTIAIMGNLAAGLANVGQYEKAINLNEKAFKYYSVELEPDHPKLLTIRNAIGRYKLKNGDIDQALSILEDVVQKSRMDGHIESIHFQNSLSSLAETYRIHGKYEKAMELFVECYEIRKQTLEMGHPNLIQSMLAIARTHRSLGNADLAIPILEDAIELNSEISGPDHDATLSIMSELADSYLDNGQPGRAINLMETTVELRKTKHGIDHVETISAMGNLGGVYNDVRRPKRAIPLLEIALKWQEENYSADHLNTLAIKNSLANAYGQTGQHDSAIAMLEELLEIAKSKFGMDHPTTHFAINNLAVGYMKSGQDERGLPLVKQAYKLTRENLGKHHPNTLSRMNNLATAYERTGRFEKSVQILKEAIPIYERKLGHDHPKTIRITANLAISMSHFENDDSDIPILEDAYARIKLHPILTKEQSRIGWHLLHAYSQGRQSEKAAILTDELLNPIREKYSDDPIGLGSQLVKFGNKLLSSGAIEKAEDILRECWEIRRVNQPKAWGTFNAKSALGAALLLQDKYAEAEPLLVSGYEGMRDRYDAIPENVRIARITDALTRLIELSTATDAHEDAEQWQAELDELEKE